MTKNVKKPRMAELVKGGISGEGAEADAETEEGLSHCGVPHLWLDQLLPLWCEEEEEAFEREMSKLDFENFRK